MEKEKAQNWVYKNRELIGLEKPEIVERKSGESNHNFVIESGEEKYILRVSRGVSREDRLENEAEKLEFLQAQGVERVPKKLFFQEKTDLGTLLLETFVGEEDLGAEEMTEERLKSAARKTARIHSISVENYNSYFNKSKRKKASLKEVFRRDYENWSKRPYREYKDIADEPDSRIEKYFRKQRKLLKSVPDIEVERSLIHGDLGFNIRATGNEIFIVDWEFSRIGYPGNELLYLFEHEKLSGEQREIFLGEYREHQDLGPGFEKIYDIYPGFLAFNDAVWAAKRIEIEPEEESKHRRRLEQRIEKLEQFYSENPI